MTKTYTISKHTVDRAELRFGISVNNVSKWINEAMSEAKQISTQISKGVRQAIYESVDGIRLVVDTQTRHVVTVYPKISADFLKPVMQRELNKAERQATRERRALELQSAMELRNYAEHAINKAKARNPKTQALIDGRMIDTQSKIDALKLEVARVDERLAEVRKTIGHFAR